MKQDGTPVKSGVCGDSLDDLGLGKCSSGDGESSGCVKLEQDSPDDRNGRDRSPGHPHSGSGSGAGGLDGLDSCAGGGSANRSGSRSGSEHDDDDEEDDEMSDERDVEAEDDAEADGSLQSSCSFDGSASAASTAYPFADVYGAATASAPQPTPAPAALGVGAGGHQKQLSMSGFAAASGQPAAIPPFHPLVPMPEGTSAAAQSSYYHFAS